MPKDKKKKKKKNKLKNSSFRLWDCRSGILLPEEVGVSTDNMEMVFLKMLVEDSGELQETYVALDSMEEAFELIKHFKSSIEPIEVT